MILAAGLQARPADDERPGDPSPGDATPVAASLNPEPKPGPEQKPERGNSVQWGALAEQASLFLTIEHGFRLATDPVTRERAGGSFFGGYVDSLTNLHGWGDGDPFIVNYVGHPLQGAIS